MLSFYDSPPPPSSPLHSLRTKNIRSMNEGLVASSLFLTETEIKDNSSRDFEGGGCSPSPASSYSSSATAVTVFSTLVALSGSFAYGAALGYSSPAESGIMNDLGLSMAEFTFFGSTLTIGGMVGAITSGMIADSMGRRAAMWVSETFCTIGWLTIAFSKGAWQLDIGRLLIGFGVGVLCYVVPVYIAEIAPKNLRGQFTGLVEFFVSCGVMLTYCIGSIVSWRILALVGAIPCLVHLIGLFFVPESPRWLAKVGLEIEFEASLQLLRGENADISHEAANIKDYIESVEQISKAGFLDIFQLKYAHCLLVGVGLMLLREFGGLKAFTFYTSFILNSAGFSSKIGSFAFGLVQIPGCAVCTLLLDKCGRRLVLMVSTAGSCFGCFLTGLSFFLKDLHWWEEATPILALTGSLVFISFLTFGMAGVPWIIVSEIFPINIKGPAGSLVSSLDWFSSWVVAYTFNLLFEWSSAGIFFMYASIWVLGLVFITKLVPETKGRTLEEIQASITQLLQ